MTTSLHAAVNERTWPEGDTETYHWIELFPDSWLGVNRLPENSEEADKLRASILQEETEKGFMHLRCNTRYIRQTADRDTFKIIEI